MRGAKFVASRSSWSASRCLRVLFDAGAVAGLTDGQLLERFAARCGESASWPSRPLVQRHGPMVLRVCRATLGDEHEAEDAFQATFLILARKAGSLWVGDSLGPWLYRVSSRIAVRTTIASGHRKVAERQMAKRASDRFSGEEPKRPRAGPLRGD